MRKLLIPLLLGATLYVQGCAAPGQRAPVPQTPRQAIVVAYGVLEGAYNTVMQRWAAGLITQNRALGIVAAINRADGYVDKADEAVKAGDVAAAGEYLGLAQSILNEIEKELQKDE